MIQNEKVLSEPNDDELFEMIKSQLQDDQFINMNKKDDAAVAKKRDQFIDEVIQILKRQGTEFKGPISAYTQLFE